MAIFSSDSEGCSSCDVKIKGVEVHGFAALSVEDSGSDITTMNQGLYKFNVMPFGLKNTPTCCGACFERSEPR